MEPPQPGISGNLGYPGEKIVIGWREWVALPDLNIPGIKAKIDTGARTSAIHASDMEVFEIGGRRKVRFSIHPLQRKRNVLLYCEADIEGQRIVADSGGHRELRYVIRTTLSLADVQWSAELTLTQRDTLKFRMLLGRTALRERFLIDPEKSYLTGRQLARSYPKSRRRKEGENENRHSFA